MGQINEKEISRILRDHGVKPTRQRLQIAAVLLAEPQHLSADQVLAAAGNGVVGVSKATVYNTLGLFARKGLVREVIVDSSKVFYDSTTTPHYHVYNVDTGMLMDLDADSFGLGLLPEPPPGTVIDGVDVVIRVRSSNDSSLLTE